MRRKTLGGRRSGKKERAGTVRTVISVADKKPGPFNNYPSMLDAAQGLLSEVCQIVSTTGLNFAIIGGWSPFLLNSNPIQHPGTRDVDILFEQGVKRLELKNVIQKFLASQYLPSAKHEFQLLRVLNVCENSVVFNVDILHPSEGNSTPEMFVDHLELPIPSSRFRDDHFLSRSIVLPHSQFLFDGHTTSYELISTLPSGVDVITKVPLMSEVGTIVTKSQSAMNKKRRRDAFDIYLAVAQARDRRALIQNVFKLKDTNRPVFNTLYSIKDCVQEGRFAENTMMYLPQDQSGSWLEQRLRSDQLKQRIDKTMDQFFVDVALDEKASYE